MSERVFYRRFEDGSKDYGNGVIGPSGDDVHHADLTRGQDHLRILSRGEKLVDRVNPPKLDEFVRSFFSRLPPPVKLGLAAGLASAALSIMAACSGGGAGSENEPKPTPTTTPRPTPEKGSVAGISIEDYREEDLELPFPASETWYFTGGPHFDGLSQGVRYAADFATETIVPCPAGPIRERHVTAAASGRVIISGNENDRYDRNHSVVVIQHESGLRTGYMHLANIEVEVDQWVEQGDVLGNPSCEYPPRGAAEAVHVHFFVRDQQGRPIRIAGFTLSGWQVNETRGNYQGTMTRAGSHHRTATRGRCGPQEDTIRLCGGIRNDLGERDADPVTPIATPQIEKIRSVLMLDGDGDGVIIEDSESLHLREEITIETRIKLADFTETDGGNAVLAKGISNEPYALWASFFKCLGWSPAAFFDSIDWACAEQIIEQGQQIDLAVTFNKREIILYMNGREVGRKIVEGGLSENFDPLLIGLSPVPGDEDFAGEIDYLALWRKVRTPEQIRSDYEGGIGSVADAEAEGLVCYLEFNGNFLDSTSNHNDGQPLGDAHIETILAYDQPRPLTEPD